jgi:DNA polymerase V
MQICRADREKSKRLMRAIDAINFRTNGSLQWAAEGIHRPGRATFNRKSPRFTTCWNELPAIK